MLLKYLKRIKEDYRGVHHSGYSRITNDIRKCDRLGNIEYRMLEELLNLANISKKDIVKVDKWKIQKMLNVKERRVEQVSQDLKSKGFIKDFEKDGTRYVFELVDNISDNPYVVLSEIEYMAIDSLRPKTKSDLNRMLDLIKDIKNLNQSELINTFLSDEVGGRYNAYYEFVVKYLTSNGVKFKPEKNLSNTLHEQKVKRHIEEIKRITELEEDINDGEFDPDEYF